MAENEEIINEENQESTETQDVNDEIKELAPIGAPSVFEGLVDSLDEEAVTTTQEVDLEDINPNAGESGLVWEITFMADRETRKEGLVYTLTPPVINDYGNITIHNAFGRKDLSENVLKTRLIKESCRKALSNPNIVIPATSGVLLKAEEPQEWMSRDETVTQAVFDKKVLDTFREIQEDVANNLAPAPRPMHNPPPPTVHASELNMNEYLNSNNYPPPQGPPPQYPPNYPSQGQPLRSNNRSPQQNIYQEGNITGENPFNPQAPGGNVNHDPRYAHLRKKQYSNPDSGVHYPG